MGVRFPGGRHSFELQDVGQTFSTTGSMKLILRDHHLALTILTSSIASKGSIFTMNNWWWSRQSGELTIGRKCANAGRSRQGAVPVHRRQLEGKLLQE